MRKDLCPKLSIGQIRYLIPNQCFQFVSQNQSDINQTIVQSVLKSTIKSAYKKYIDSYHLDYQFHILKQLQTSFRVTPIQEILICPKILKNSGWKILNQREWSKLSSQNQSILQYKIPTIFLQNDPDLCYRGELVKISAVFQSHKCIKAFSGYLSASLPITKIITILGSQLGFYGFSALSFSVIDSQTCLSYSDIQSMNAGDLKDTSFIVSNLNFGDQNASSMMAQRSGHASWEQFLEDNNSQQQMSVSTAIDIVPNTGRSDRQNHRIRIFGSKKKQYIQELKRRSLQIINGQKITIPTFTEQSMNQHLEQLAKQSLNMLNF